MKELHNGVQPRRVKVENVLTFEKGLNNITPSLKWGKNGLHRGRANEVRYRVKLLN